MTQAQSWWLCFTLLVVLVLLYFLRPVLEPFLFAGLLAYLGDPLVDYLTKLKLPRTLAVAIVFLIIILAVVVLLLFLVPLLARQIQTLLQRLPDALSWIQQFGLPWLQAHLNINQSLDLPDLRATLAKYWQQVGDIAAIIWKTVAASGLGLISWLIKLLLIPIVTFYLLRDWKRVLGGLRQLLPRRIEPTIVNIVQECNSVLGAFFRGQLLVMLALAIFYSFALWIAGLDLAMLIGSITGLLTIIPYLGVTIGLLASAIAAFVQFHAWLNVGYVAIVFAIGHVLENYILVPGLVGDRIGLHPVAVIFAVLAGGHLAGFFGVLVALPVAAVIMVLLRHVKSRYQKSALYRHS